MFSSLLIKVDYLAAHVTEILPLSLHPRSESRYLQSWRPVGQSDEDSVYITPLVCPMYLGQEMRRGAGEVELFYKVSPSIPNDPASIMTPDVGA